MAEIYPRKWKFLGRGGDKQSMRDDFEQYAGEVQRGLEENAQQAPPRPVLESISAIDLQHKDIPPIRWAVQDLILSGLSILASPPKFGKSWMAMDLCVSVALGGEFLGYRCHKSGCLYLALEDSERRLKKRLRTITDQVQAPEEFEFVTMAPTLSAGLVDALSDYIKLHPGTGMIVIDTLQKVRDVGGSKDVYGRDYNDIGTLKRFADIHNIALLLIHHLRKMGDDSDPFARISGTNGIAGAADTMMVLAKEKRGDSTATLSITGRDVEQTDLVLRFNKEFCIWENLGDAEKFAEQQARNEYRNSLIIKTIRKLLEQTPEGWTGTAQQLLDAGTFIARTRLAESPRELSSKLKDLGGLLFEYDGIMYERKQNGTGGGKHRFYHAASQPEELRQTEMSPFSGG